MRERREGAQRCPRPRQGFDAAVFCCRALSSPLPSLNSPRATARSPRPGPRCPSDQTRTAAAPGRRASGRTCRGRGWGGGGRPSRAWVRRRRRRRRWHRRARRRPRACRRRRRRRRRRPVVAWCAGVGCRPSTWRGRWVRGKGGARRERGAERRGGGEGGGGGGEVDRWPNASGRRHHCNFTELAPRPRCACVGGARAPISAASLMEREGPAGLGRGEEKGAGRGHAHGRGGARPGATEGSQVCREG